MCGIAGVFGPRSDGTAEALAAMVAAQIHRGPDDSGAAFVELGDHLLALGQRRLSIIDLSPLGRQPMEHPQTGDLLVYNGELYNYKSFRRRLEAEGVRFQGHSDTEVMLSALVRWGPGVISQFCGMFAIAWFRRAQRTLVLARDPVGIKPLYYARTPQGFLFASEVRAILASSLVPRQISRRGLAGMLAYGAVQDPETIIDGVRSFPAGCYSETDMGDLLSSGPAAPVRYWSPPEAAPMIDPQEGAARVRSLLDEAVREHLVSDVPVGVFLSSGIDSTVIAALAAQHAPNLTTYTVGFADNEDLSETALAARTAAHLGLPHVDVQVTGAEALSYARQWLESLDQPSIDGLNTFLVAGAVKRAGATVALSGLGGDEIFCGYGTFRSASTALRYMRWLRRVPRPVRSLLARGAGLRMTSAARAKLRDMLESQGRLLDLYFLSRRMLSDRQLARLGIDAQELNLNDHFLDSAALDGLSIDERFPFAGISIMETRYYAGNTLLRDSDANGMAHSLEIRVPMFDTRLMDYAMSLTGSTRMPSGRPEKHVLRTGFSDLIGPQVLQQAKRGFALPIRRWMTTSMREECESAIESLKGGNLLRRDGIDAVWRAFLDEPQTSSWTRAFSLVVLGRYLARIGAFSMPRVRAHSHWRRTPSSNATFGINPSSASLRPRSA